MAAGHRLSHIVLVSYIQFFGEDFRVGEVAL